MVRKRRVREGLGNDTKSGKKPKIHDEGGHRATLNEGDKSGSGDTALDPKDIQRNKKRDNNEDGSGTKSKKKPKNKHVGRHGEMLDKGDKSGSGRERSLDPKLDLQSNLVKSSKVDLRADPKKDMQRKEKRDNNEDGSGTKSKKKPENKHEGRHGEMLDKGDKSDSGGERSLDPKLDLQSNLTTDGEENDKFVDTGLVKSSKVDTRADPKKVSVGHGVNVNGRHIKQLERLLALMPMERHPLKVSNEKADVLDMPSTSNGVYLEWDKADDRYFLWARSASKMITMKFEFHGGFTTPENLLEIKNPLLIFSESFGDNDHWRIVQQLLQELFGSLDEKSTNCEHDYVFAFTRTGVMVHFRVFKLLSSISSVMDNMKLQEVSPAFILKPVKINVDSAESMGVSIKHMKNPFFDRERLMVENKDGLCLDSRAVFYDKSCPTMIPHVMQSPHSCIMLPSPANKSQLFEFNTSFEEFFERFNVTKKTHVPGTGTDPNPFTKSVSKLKKKKVKHVSQDPTQVAAIPPQPIQLAAVEFEQISPSMKVFCRSLIKYAGDLFKEGACLNQFDEGHIFMRNGKLVIVGVEVMEFTEKQAKNNCNTIANIIASRIPVLPPDVQAVTDLLRDPNVLDKYELIVNNVVWMEALERNHVVIDLHEDFTEFLGADAQVTLTKNLEGIEQSEAKFKKNWLIYACSAYSLPVSATESDEGMKNYLERKARELQNKPDDLELDVLTNSKEELDLYVGRRYFGNIRHLYIHLSNTARKWKKMKGLTVEEKDLVVSSEFAATISSIQVHVPLAFVVTDSHKASYARFRRYFKNAEFDSSDEKQEVVA